MATSKDPQNDIPTYPTTASEYSRTHGRYLQSEQHLLISGSDNTLSNAQIILPKRTAVTYLRQAKDLCTAPDTPPLISCGPARHPITSDLPDSVTDAIIIVVQVHSDIADILQNLSCCKRGRGERGGNFPNCAGRGYCKDQAGK